MCADPKMLDDFEAARRAYAEIRRHLAPGDRELLASAERFWRWKIFDCSNADRATGTYKRLDACIPAVLGAQAAYLREAEADGRSVRRHVADFTIVDVAYLSTYAPAFVDHRVTVSGMVRMRGCEPTYHPAIGLGRLTWKRRSVVIRFEGLSEGQWGFLCLKQPTSSWTGVVRREDGRFVLVADDVLGAPFARRAE